MAQAHDDIPGELPEIRDEAADTPMWVPALGFALLVLGALFLVYRSATEEPEEAPVIELAEGAGAEGEGAEEAAPAADGEAEEGEDAHAGHDHP